MWSISKRKKKMITCICMHYLEADVVSSELLSKNGNCRAVNSASSWICSVVPCDLCVEITLALNYQIAFTLVHCHFLPSITTTCKFSFLLDCTQLHKRSHDHENININYLYVPESRMIRVAPTLESGTASTACCKLLKFPQPSWSTVKTSDTRYSDTRLEFHLLTQATFWWWWWWWWWWPEIWLMKENNS